MPLAGRDIVCFSNDWGGDPLSKTHLMRILARENRVLWVDSLGNRAPRPTVRDARRIAHKLRNASRGLVEAERNEIRRHVEAAEARLAAGRPRA